MRYPAIQLAALGTAAAIVVTVIGCSGQQQSPEAPTATETPGAPGAGPGGSGTLEAPSAQPSSPASATTGLTVSATEGPYYVSGTRELEGGNLNYTNLPGEEVRIVGHVYGGAGKSKPLAGAKVEMWEADSRGRYHPNEGGAASDFSSDEIALRGYVLTDESGFYAIDAVYPGYYEGRTRHIHVMASADGYKTIATQLIVPALDGDGVTPPTDEIAESLPEANHVIFSDRNGVPTTTFDFHIAAD